MCRALRIALATLVISGCVDSNARVQAQMRASTVESGRVDETIQNESTVAADSSPGVSSRDAWGDETPRGGFGQPFGFPWLKFSLVLIALFVWLKTLQLCVDDGRNQQLQVDSWSKKLFAIGFSGNACDSSVVCPCRSSRCSNGVAAGRDVRPLGIWCIDRLLVRILPFMHRDDISGPCQLLGTS
jgi:hypothetical protein